MTLGWPWTYMNIKGQGHSLILVQGHSDSTFSNFFSLETVRPIEAKFHVELPCDGKTKVSSNGPGHMTNMATMVICGKNLKKSSGTKTLMTLKVGMQDRELEYYQVCSNDDPGWPLTYFTARSNLTLMLLHRNKGKTMDFSETLVVCIKVGRCSQLNKYMKLN